MDDQAQYSNMMNQLNAINSQGREMVNEKKEDQQEKLNEYKKTLEMTTEGIGGGILHDVGMNLITKGLTHLKDKIPVPTEELEKMVQDYKDGGAKKMFEGMTKRGYSKAKSKIFGASTDGEDGETAVKKVFGKLFQTAKSQVPSNISTKLEENLTPLAPTITKKAGVVRANTDPDTKPVVAPDTKPVPAPRDPSTIRSKPTPKPRPTDFDKIENNKDFQAARKGLDDRYAALPQENKDSIDDALTKNTLVKTPAEIKALPTKEAKRQASRELQTARQSAISDEESKLSALPKPKPIPTPIPKPVVVPEENTLAQKAKTTLSQLQPLEDDTQKEADTAVSGTGFLGNLFGKKPSSIDPSLIDNDEDSGILQRPKQIGGKILQGLGQEEEEDGGGFGGILGGFDKLAQAATLGSQLFKRGETGKQREQLLGSTAKQTVIDNVKDQTTGALSDAITGNEDSDNLITAGLKAASGGAEKDLADTSIKKVAEKAGTRLAETDAELGGPEDPFGDVISGIVGLGTLLGGIFGAKAKHLPPQPSYVPINPTFQSGA